MHTQFDADVDCLPEPASYMHFDPFCLRQVKHVMKDVVLRAELAAAFKFTKWGRGTAHALTRKTTSCCGHGRRRCW